MAINTCHTTTVSLRGGEDGDSLVFEFPASREGAVGVTARVQDRILNLTFTSHEVDELVRALVASGFAGPPDLEVPAGWTRKEKE